jgi:succinyl-CoA synthetase beta subunit
VEEGKRMLKESGLNFTTADSMSEGANAVVALANSPLDAAPGKAVRA